MGRRHHRRVVVGQQATYRRRTPWHKRKHIVALVALWKLVGGVFSFKAIEVVVHNLETTGWELHALAAAIALVVITVAPAVGLTWMDVD